MHDSESELFAALARIDEWKGKTPQYRLVEGGITNLNWRVAVDGHAYFVKIPGKGTEAFIDRGNAHVANVIAEKEGIGPRVFYYFEDTGVEVFEWLEGYRTLTYGDVFNKDIFHRIVATIRRLHQHRGTILPVTKNPFEQTHQMMALAKSMGGYLPPEIDRMEWLVKRIEDSIMTAGIEYVPCHVDHWTANYLYKDVTDDLRLTDFEYASMNDPGWDFAGISTTNYFTEGMDVEWIRAYCGEMDEVMFARFKLYKILSDINWAMWSSVQSRQSEVSNFDYHMWMGTKLTRLRLHWQDPRLDYWLNLVKGIQPFSAPTTTAQD